MATRCRCRECLGESSGKTLGRTNAVAVPGARGTESPGDFSVGRRLVHPCERGVVGMRSVRTMAAFAAVCFVTLGAAAGACAQAHRTTHVSFVISKNQTADTPEHYTYSVRNAPRGAVIVLQRQRGGGWKTLRKFTRHSGHGSITQSIGEYVLRVAVLKNHHVRAQKQRTFFVYGDIPFSALCDAANVQWGNNDRGCNRSTA